MPRPSEQRHSDAQGCTSSQRSRPALPNDQGNQIVASECMIRLDHNNALQLRDVLTKMTTRPSDHETATKLLGQIEALQIDDVYKSQIREVIKQINSNANITTLNHVQCALVTKTGQTHEGCEIVAIDTRDTHAIVKKDGHRYRVPLRDNIEEGAREPHDQQARRSIFSQRPASERSSNVPDLPSAMQSAMQSVRQSARQSVGQSTQSSATASLTQDGGCGCGAGRPEARKSSARNSKHSHKGGARSGNPKDSIATYQSTSSSAMPGLCE